MLEMGGKDSAPRANKTDVPVFPLLQASHSETYHFVCVVLLEKTVLEASIVLFLSVPHNRLVLPTVVP